MNGLGRRQRRMLADMAVFGPGCWPQGWKLRADDRTVLDSLQRKNLVSGQSLTEAGAALALSLLSESQHRMRERLTAKRRSGVA